MTARLSHIFMLTSDLLAERRLLVDLIGLTVLLEEDRYLRIGAPTGFHVGLEEGRPGPSDGTEINIEVDDVDHVFARLEAGRRRDGGIARTRGMGRSARLVP